MKFLIAVVLLAAVAGVYSEPAITADINAAVGGGGAKGAKGGSLSPQAIAQLEEILTRAAGPKVSKLAVKLLTTLTNKVLKGIPLGKVLGPVVNLVHKTAKSGGSLEKLLAGGNAKALKGKGNNISPADQAALEKVLARTVGPYTAKYLVQTVAIASNGLLGKLHLGKLLHGVGGLVKNVAKPKGLVGKLIGQKGLGKPISKLLGAGSKGGKGGKQ